MTNYQLEKLHLPSDNSQQEEDPHETQQPTPETSQQEEDSHETQQPTPDNSQQEEDLHETQQLTPETSQQKEDQHETQQLTPDYSLQSADFWLSIAIGPTLYSAPERINMLEYLTNLELIFNEEDQEFPDLDQEYNCCETIKKRLNSLNLYRQRALGLST